MGRCPHPTLPEYCFRPFLLGYHSQQALLALWALMGRCPHLTLPEYCFRLFSAGPVGALSRSDFDFVGPVGPVGTLSLSDHVGVLSPTVPVGEPSPMDPDSDPPRGIGSGGLDGIPGLERPCFYAVAC